MSTAWHTFESLLPKTHTVIATVGAHVGTRSKVTTLEGDVMLAEGTGVQVGKRAYVTDGVVVGEAPDLPYYDLYV